jgi:hypothetical protein
MARTVLQDVDRVLASKSYAAWALLHASDDRKIRLERGGTRRPTSDDPWARTFIEAIRVGLEWDQPPPPALPSLAELARNVMFTAQNPEAALRCPPHWRIALSADPKYDAAARLAAPKIKQAGHLLAVWGVQTQIGADRIREFGKTVGADFLIFQAETVEEFNTAVQAGAQIIVGNPNAWTDTQRSYAIARVDTLAVLFEVYANAGSPWPDTASAQGVPVTTEVLGVGSWENRPDVQLKEYQAHTPPGVWQTMSVYLAENMNEESWGLLP